MADPLDSPVVVDGIVSDEKLANLLGLGTEYAELDFKATIDLADKKQLLELVKDVAAMQARGGYIVGGIDDDGFTSKMLDGVDLKVFDEARLVPKLRKWLPAPLKLITRATERGGHKVIIICIEPHPAGCVFMQKDGAYVEKGQQKCLFREGEVFWRNGTSSVRLDQQGFEQVMAKRIEAEKTTWMREQRQIRRAEEADLAAEAESPSELEAEPSPEVEQRSEPEQKPASTSEPEPASAREPTSTPAPEPAAPAPPASGALGAVNIDLEQDALNRGAIEMARQGDAIGFKHLLNEARARARALIGQDAVDAELSDLLDRLTCLAATFLVYEQAEWFSRTIETFAQIYSMPLKEGDAQRFGYGTQFDPAEVAPRVWLRVIERVYALGALAVREEDWDAVRTLTVQSPRGLLDYDKSWLRHALTIASRAQHLREQKDGQSIELSLLSLAQAVISKLDCLRLDGVAVGDDAILTSLAQFDLLSNIVAIDNAGTLSGGVFYTSFARFRQERVDPIAERLLTDQAMRDALVKRDDDDLAIALRAIGQKAHQVGFVVDGFRSWDYTPVAQFLAEHRPAEEA